MELLLTNEFLQFSFLVLQMHLQLPSSLLIMQSNLEIINKALILNCTVITKNNQ